MYMTKTSEGNDLWVLSVWNLFLNKMILNELLKICEDLSGECRLEHWRARMPAGHG